MKMICSFCGKTVSKSPVIVKRYAHSFCNRMCYHHYQKQIWTYPKSGKIKVSCSFCGSEIFRHPSQIKNHMFCNRTCSYNYMKEKKKHSLFHRLKKAFGGASNENTKNQKVPCKGIQGFAQSQN
jgi:hypothetical protein